MCDGQFRRNEWPSLGVEIELQLIDRVSKALRSGIVEVLDGLPDDLCDWVKPEFMQSCVEINTDVCRTVREVTADLARKVSGVEAVAERAGMDLFWAGTHPFSLWRDQQITPDERYFKLADLLRETVVRPVTFGLHVHVGIGDGDECVRVSNGLQRHLPLLLALSANSPFWQGRLTGHQAHRVEVLEAFPTGGLPPLLDDWEHYQRLVARMRTAGFIDSQRELWWDLRPNAKFGTLEVRICDMPPDLESLGGLVALIQCLVDELRHDPRLGRNEPEFHGLMVRQNRWRACRYGMSAVLVDLDTLEAHPVREVLARSVERLGPVAEKIGCKEELEGLVARAQGPSGAESQIALHAECGDLAEMIGRRVEVSRIGVPSLPAAIPVVSRGPTGAVLGSFVSPPQGVLG